MSNPTLATKLVTLVKGIFGRKEPAATSEPAVKETPAGESGTATEEAKPKKIHVRNREAAEPAPAPEESGAGEVKGAGAAPEAAEPEAEEKAAEAAPEAAETEEARTAESADSGQEPRTEPVTPATSDVPEEGEAIAEELEAAEAHTTVASDEVLDKVRKKAAPSMEDLAVPTYDELTLPSVRARLRKLTVEQVRDLRAYEVAHQGRPEFVRMYDNRINKLESGA